MKTIDNFLNKITMYRLTLYYLISLIGIAIVLSIFGILRYNPLDIAINSLAAIIVGFIFNLVFAKIFKAVTNVESVYITALILALIVPVTFPQNLAFISLAAAAAMASKYLLTIDKKHVFNPAAVAVAAIAMLSPQHAATWWVGTSVMLPFVLVGGLLLVRKTQREDMVFNFLSLYLIVISAGVILRGGSLLSIFSTLRLNVLDSALFFFMFVMFTEPLTSPTTKQKRNYFAYFVALLYATPSLRLGFALTPEIALVLGNVFSYIISPTARFVLSLQQKIKLSSDTYEFVFNKTPDFNFTPGQYMEWTLPHQREDSRGNRRYFSIASSPTEDKLSMTVKFYDPSSTYKKRLISLEPGEKIIASQVAGDFILPKNLKKQFVFIAGGVGIAPFRSMIQYIIDKNLTTDIILLFTNRTKEDILFAEIFDRARLNGVKTIYNLTNAESAPQDWTGTVGYITPEKIQQLIPDYKNRVYYLSGPQPMVQNFEETLRKVSVPSNQITKDFFPGYTDK